MKRSVSMLVLLISFLCDMRQIKTYERIKKLLGLSKYREVGGDGTFLLAASRVRQNTKPVIGFNSDPLHSEGFLCLPKEYSSCVEDVLLRLKEWPRYYRLERTAVSDAAWVYASPQHMMAVVAGGSFSWMFRTRIRVTLRRKENEPPAELHDKKMLGPHRTQLRSLKYMSSAATPQPLSTFRTLPPLALNEVFLGESLSSQVSYFEMRPLPDGERTKVKSSGLCICTGTGSTSWHLSMNSITSQGVTQILECAGILTLDCDAIAKKYNNSLLFDPEELQMCYTVRDLISAGVWPSPPGLAPRGFARALWIRSYCRDAKLVVDGGTSYTFNDGSEALFELYPEDTLRTVVL